MNETTSRTRTVPTKRRMVKTNTSRPRSRSRTADLGGAVVPNLGRAYAYRRAPHIPAPSNGFHERVPGSGVTHRTPAPFSVAQSVCSAKFAQLARDHVSEFHIGPTWVELSPTPLTFWSNAIKVGFWYSGRVAIRVQRSLSASFAQCFSSVVFGEVAILCSAESISGVPACV